jgi:DNA-binding FadR family transcriptional regulator
MSSPAGAAPGAAPGKRAAQIALRIEADIIRDGCPVGESLGSEDELRQRYGVSRSVLREAVRLVEHHRVARMRRGPGGGLFVSAPDAGPAATAVVVYLEHRGATAGDLLAARRVLEPLAAARAAAQIDDAGINRLRGIPPVQQHDIPVVIAELSKNPVLQLFIDVLMRLTARYGGVADDGYADVVAAVTAGDPQRAEALCRRRIASTTAPSTAPPQTRPTVEARQGKRAEMLATAIGADIAASGLPVGSIFATEAELLRSYRVSRSILREALRLLEYHTIAVTRRGPGGGLLVTEPCAQASIDTFALYLEYRKPGSEDLQMVRDAVELDTGNVVSELFLRILAELSSRCPDGSHEGKA